MDHPNIAHVYDGGATETGRPYFVMELVRGVPITAFSDENRLSVRQRLGLFIDVCHAVQHAHQKGVIHRDLKPTNVLVTMHADKAVPKVIDFGIAKATAGTGPLTDKTLFTEFRQLIGTPEYMSPEQAQLSGIDVDTRSDIYALGVLLYELLTGVTPFDRRHLRESSLDELRRIICDVEPDKPSTRVAADLRVGRPASEPRASASGDADHNNTRPLPHGRGSDSHRASGSSSADIARARHTDPKSLVRLLRGDLDWVVLKCLEKNRNRRYETANGLAADVQRHLAGELVVAAPASRLYRLRKTLRRYRVPAAIGIAFVLLILCGILVSTVFWQRAERESHIARDQAEKAAQISGFLREMLASVNPEHARGREVSVRAVLDSAARTIEERFADRPLVEAELRETLGTTYGSLGDYAAGETHLRRALEILRRELGDAHPDTLRTADELAQALQWSGRYGEPEELFVRTLATSRRVLGDGHDVTLTSLNNLGLFYWKTARYAEAEPLLMQASEASRRTHGEEHESTLSPMHNVALVIEARGRYAEAETLFQRVLAIRQRLDPESPTTIDTMDGLAALYVRLDRLSEAESLQVKALEMSQRILGPEHPRTLVSMDNLAVCYQYQNRWSESLGLREQVVATSRRVLGEEHPQTLSSKRNLAVGYADIGRCEDGARLTSEVLDVQRRVVGTRHPDTLITLNNLAALNRRFGRLDEAEPLYREALDTQIDLVGEDHIDTLRTMHNLAFLYREARRYDDAEPLCTRALEKMRRVLGDEHSMTLLAMINLALLCDLQGRYEAAEPFFQEAVSTARRVLPADHEWRLGWTNHLAWFLIERHRCSEAEPLLLETWETVKDDPRAPGPSATADRKRKALERIIKLYETWDAAEPGMGYDQKAAEWRRRMEADMQTEPGKPGPSP